MNFLELMNDTNVLISGVKQDNNIRNPQLETYAKIVTHQRKEMTLG